MGFSKETVEDRKPEIPCRWLSSFPQVPISPFAVTVKRSPSFSLSPLFAHSLSVFACICLLIDSLSRAWQFQQLAMSPLAASDSILYLVKVPSLA